MTEPDGRRWRWFHRNWSLPYRSDGRLYLTRWTLLRTPWFGIFLHRMDNPDPRPVLHDHPWAFLSIILRGGYVERRWDPHTREVDEHHTIRRFNHMRLQDAHAITSLLRSPTWTLLIVSRRVRNWGFWEPVIEHTDSPYWSQVRSWIWTDHDIYEQANPETATKLRSVR